MKIQTEDCVQAIVDYFAAKAAPYTLQNADLIDIKAWKRVSKTGSGDSIKRTFENKKTGNIVYVFSTDTEILSVNESDDKIVTKFDNFTKPVKIKTIDKIKSQQEFIDLKINGQWKTTVIDKDDSDAYANLMYDIDDFRSELKTWGGWMCDDIEKYIDDKNIKVENHYLKGSDIVEIDSISLGDKLLLWSLHED